jgi:hypothetical protein
VDLEVAGPSPAGHPTGGSLAAAFGDRLTALYCSQPGAATILATLTGNAATINLASACSTPPYDLVVYSASDNVVEPYTPSVCPMPLDPRAYCSFPIPSALDSVTNTFGTPKNRKLSRSF